MTARTAQRGAGCLFSERLALARLVEREFDSMDETLKPLRASRSSLGVISVLVRLGYIRRCSAPRGKGGKSKQP